MLLISIVSKRPSSRSQKVPAISKRPKYLKTSQLKISKPSNYLKTSQLTISKFPNYLKSPNFLKRTVAERYEIHAIWGQLWEVAGNRKKLRKMAKVAIPQLPGNYDCVLDPSRVVTIRLGARACTELRKWRLKIKNA